MRKIITYLFIGAFLLHASSRLLVYANFWMNQEYIAEKLCENKDKPEMECNGKCHLKKELEKEDKRKQQEERKIQVEELVFIPQSEIKEVIDAVYTVEKVNRQHFFVIQQKTNGFSPYIFHPPVV